MLSISSHSKQRAAEYGISVKQLENLENKYRIPNFPVAILVCNGNRGNKFFAVIRNETVVTIVDFFRIPKPERFNVEQILM